MKMQFQETILFSFVICVFAFEESLYVFGDGSQEMLEKGRQQYQLLRERGNLPQYGNCWKAAVEHVDDGCRNLSEDTQSDIALHLTNCFLAMSGHQTYNCELDRKPNLRGICINSMSDRAFNVYTEFYTHTQNMCWFLRGQIWHEQINENTRKVGKQLEKTAENQENLLKAQQESLSLQERLISHGKNLEDVMDRLYNTTNLNKDVINLLVEGVNNLRSWLVGEMSWIDSIFYYSASAIVIFIFTSTIRTVGARIPLYVLLISNFVAERIVYAYNERNLNLSLNTDHFYDQLMYQIWLVRYFMIFCMIFLYIFHYFKFRDFQIINNKLLKDIFQQNEIILRKLNALQNNNDKFDILNETNSSFNKLETDRHFENVKSSSSFYEKKEFVYSNGNAIDSSPFTSASVKDLREKILKNGKNNSFNSSANQEPLGRYNLRSRQGTPDSSISSTSRSNKAYSSKINI